MICDFSRVLLRTMDVSWGVSCSHRLLSIINEERRGKGHKAKNVKRCD